MVQGIFLLSLRVAELWSCGELLGRADLTDALEPPVRTGPIRRADEASRRLVADELPEELGRLPAGRKPRKDGTAKARKGNPCAVCKRGTRDAPLFRPLPRKPLEIMHPVHGMHRRRRFCIGK